MKALLTTFAALLLATALSAQEPAWPKGVTLPAGEPVDETYRLLFGECDRAGTWRGVEGRYTHGCGADPNSVTALRRLPGGAIAFVSKLAVDMDGSAFACGPSHGRMDQCGTTLMLPGKDGADVPTDADVVPYVVIPAAGPGDERGLFSRLTGVGVGDFGVVIANGRTVPVIVADTGPYPKLGEGSLALHRALGHEQCTEKASGVCSVVPHEGDSIGGAVTTVLFPGSAVRGLTPETIVATTQREAIRRWKALQRTTTRRS